MTKTFETVFKIGGKYAAGPAFGKLNQDLDRSRRNARDTAGAMRKAFGRVTDAAHRMRGALKGAVIGAGATVGAGAIAAGTAAAYAMVKGFQASIDAALAVEKTQEHLAASLEKTAKRWGLNQKQIKLQQQAITALGDRMAKLGPDGETVVAMLDEVTRSVDPRSLHKYSKGLTDLLISQKGVNASEEDAVALGGDVAKLIEFKMPKALKAFKGVTDDQIKAYSKLETRQEREIWFFKNIAKETGATERAFATASGKTQKFRNMLEDVAETIGEPFVKLRGQLSETGIAILEKLKPKIDLFAAGLEERLTQANKWWNEHQAEVVEAIGKIGDAVLWCIDHWKELMIAFAATAAIVALIAILGALALAIGAVTAALGLILSPIGLVVAALAGLGIGIAAVIWYWDDLKRAALGAWDAINKASQTAQLPMSTGTGVPHEPQPGDYQPEWAAPAGGGTRGQSMGQFYSAQAAAGGSPALAKTRAAAIAELNANPVLRAKLYRVAKAEVGTGDPARLQAFVEGVLTRAGVRKGGLAAALQANYYETLRGRSGAPFTAADRAKMDQAVAKAASGSNVGQYGTGNFAYRGRGLGGKGGYPSAYIGGEQFSVQAADAKAIARIKAEDRATKMVKESAPASWPGGVQYQGKSIPASTTPVGAPSASLRSMLRPIDMRGRMSGASGGQNVASLSPTITINATTTSDANAIAEKVRGALQQSSREFLATMKKSRSDELRLNLDA